MTVCLDGRRMSISFKFPMAMNVIGNRLSFVNNIPILSISYKHYHFIYWLFLFILLVTHEKNSKMFLLHFGSAAMKNTSGSKWIVCKNGKNPQKKIIILSAISKHVNSSFARFSYFFLYLEIKNVSVAYSMYFTDFRVFLLFSLLSEAIDLNLCQVIVVTVCIAAPKQLQ